jgi:hypothetical protein
MSTIGIDIALSVDERVRCAHPQGERHMRTGAALILMLLAAASSVRAEERTTTDAVAPTPAVAAAWKAEMRKPSPTLRTLLVSYGALQGVDMASTIIARNHGAVEANPVLQGSYGSGIAAKAALGCVTTFAVRALDRHSRKAAILTMIAANAATAAVAVRNMRIAARLK